MVLIRKPYPSDVSDEEWALVAPYLTLMTETAPQWQHSLRELFNGLRYVIRYGIAWRAMPNDLPPWFSVYQQSHRWLVAGVFDTLAQDLRAVLRIAAGRGSEPTTPFLNIVYHSQARNMRQILQTLWTLTLISFAVFLWIAIAFG